MHNLVGSSKLQILCLIYVKELLFSGRPRGLYARYNADFMRFVDGTNYVRNENRHYFESTGEETVDVTYTKFEVYPSLQIILNIGARRKYCVSKGKGMDWPMLSHSFDTNQLIVPSAPSF